MSTLQEIISLRLSELQEIQSTCVETLMKSKVSIILKYLADYLNNSYEDKLSLEVSRFWGGDMKPTKFSVGENLNPKWRCPNVYLTAETTGKLSDNKSSWYFTSPINIKLLVLFAGFKEPDRLFLNLRRASIQNSNFKSGISEVFALNQIQDSNEMLAEIIDLIVDPKKSPIGKYPITYNNF